MIRGSGRAFKTTGCAALLEDLFFRGGDLAGSLLSESIETVVVRAFCFAFEARSRSALPEERLSRVGAGCAALPEEPLSRGRAGCAALLEDFLFCGARVTDSLLISVSESLLSCDGEVAECLASVVPATLAGTNTLATTWKG